MIGFSSIKKISYDKWCIELENETQQVINNPDDQNAKKNLAELIDKNESNASNDPTALSNIALARLALHDTVKARQSIDKALKINPGHIIAKKLNLRLENRKLKSPVIKTR
jgi:outer membrane protein assembly factor BamD (BamD/ComL family)